MLKEDCAVVFISSVIIIAGFGVAAYIVLHDWVYGTLAGIAFASALLFAFTLANLIIWLICMISRARKRPQGKHIQKSK